jgi:fucose permease
VGVAAFTVNYLVDQGVGISHSRASLMFAFCQLTFTGGRFIGAALLRFVDTAFLLSTYGCACMACCLGVALRTGNGGIASLYMLFFFESICYPVIICYIRVLACLAPLTFSIVPFYARNEGPGTSHQTRVWSNCDGA